MLGTGEGESPSPACSVSSVGAWVGHVESQVPLGRRAWLWLPGGPVPGGPRVEEPHEQSFWGR